MVRFQTNRSSLQDTTMERNTLMAKCYPKIKDYCREKHGLEFQVSSHSRANSYTNSHFDLGKVLR